MVLLNRRSVPITYSHNASNGGSSLISGSLRRRGKKFSKATLLRMLFVMLGVIFVLYVGLMVAIGLSMARHHQQQLNNNNNNNDSYLHNQQKQQQQPPQQQQRLRGNEEKEPADPNYFHQQNHRDLRPPRAPRPVMEDPDGDGHLQVGHQPPNDWNKQEKDKAFGDEEEDAAIDNHHDSHHDPPRETNELHKEPQQQQQPQKVVLKAYLEPIDRSQWKVKPLPVRTTTAEDLRLVEYPRLNSCQNLPEQWPVDDYPDDDPFLPWIHDVFPTHDGRYIQFVAQNKRRCHTGTTAHDTETLQHTQPQLSLFQHVPIQRIQQPTEQDGQEQEQRYRLSSHEDADPDGMETRFICRFKPSMEETLSVHNIPYEYITFRKGHKQTFTERGKWDIKSLHTTQLIFQCPVPASLQQTVREGTSVVNDYATMFVDLIPIRTPPRYGSPRAFLPPRFSEFITDNQTALFRAEDEFGDDHVLPRIDDSGRWENIPVCKPSLPTYNPPKEEPKGESSVVVTTNTSLAPVKKHRLVACVWASAGYATRGERFAIHDGERRLHEWLHYNFLVGFDHVYLYDNSGASNNNKKKKNKHDDDDEEPSLESIAALFPDRVTRINWPSKVCNNNRNFADSPGERSSQYAAESSCRLRFGPHVDWIGAFDIDEYVVPVGSYNSIPPLLDKLEEEGKKIVSFGSWRAWPRKSLIVPPVVIDDRSICGYGKPCFELSVPSNRTILQTYNCDRQKGPKKDQMPAEKQLYRPDYVRQHFVHYSTVTALTMMNRTETEAAGFVWHPKVHADPLSRFADEQREGTMLHTKAIATQDTSGWQETCRVEGHGMCRIGNPYPSDDAAENNITADAEGWLYNCYVNEKIEQHWVPLLEKSMGMRNS